MQEKDISKKSSTNKEKDKTPLSETISNAHESGDGSLRLEEDGMVEPGQTIADSDAAKISDEETEAY